MRSIQKFHIFHYYPINWLIFVVFIFSPIKNCLPNISYVPSQYSDLVSAISNSNDNDTIILSKGIYPINGIDFIGKSLTVTTTDFIENGCIDTNTILIGKVDSVHIQFLDTTFYMKKLNIQNAINNFSKISGLKLKNLQIIIDQKSAQISDCIITDTISSPQYTAFETNVDSSFLSHLQFDSIRVTNRSKFCKYDSCFFNYSTWCNYSDTNSTVFISCKLDESKLSNQGKFDSLFIVSAKCSNSFFRLGFDLQQNEHFIQIRESFFKSTKIGQNSFQIFSSFSNYHVELERNSFDGFYFDLFTSNNSCVNLSAKFNVFMNLNYDNTWVAAPIKIMEKPTVPNIIYIQNCTFFNNSYAFTDPDANGNITVKNCIFWKNVKNFSCFNSTPVITYSLISDTSYLNGYHNFYSDPEFVNEALGNCSLKISSPCIDAGDPSLPVDNDKSISDIGAISYNKIPTITVNTVKPISFLNNKTNYSFDFLGRRVKKTVSRVYLKNGNKFIDLGNH